MENLEKLTLAEMEEFVANNKQVPFGLRQVRLSFRTTIRWRLDSRERISFGRYRHPETPAAAEIPLTAIAKKEKQRRISRAAQVLEPYFVNASDLNVLCGSESHFAEGEQALTDRIAKAWAELAPYGVSPDDMKKLISENLKNAWRRSRSR